MSKAVDELVSTKLFQFLNKLDGELANKCMQFVKHCEPILATINEYFPYYTRHDAGHSYQVIRRIEQIVYPECLTEGTSKSFSKIDAFLLLTAAYGHDLGMAVLPNEKNSLQVHLGLQDDEGWKTNKALQDYLRKTHSERGGEYITNNHIIAGIPIHLTQLLNLLNRSHNYSQSALHNNIGRRWSSDGHQVNLLQLACILCSADLLEYSETRVLDGVIDLLEEEIKESEDPTLIISLRENLKHAFISANLSIGDDGKIIMNGTFTDPEVLNLTYKTVDYIEKWIRDYCDIDHGATERKLRVRSDSVYTTFEMPGREFEKLGIRMNKQNVISLIASNSVWTNKPELVLRELLQNSVEACRYRAFHSPPADRYEPKIEVTIDKDERVIRIVDNGCGMSRSVILNNFLTVGNSRAKEPDYIQSDYASLARFGIGFWSVFTIADKATIKTTEYIPGDTTSSTNGMKFDVSINVLKDYILFEKTVGNAGTEITLNIKENISLSQLISSLTGAYGVICSSDIPIELKYWGNQIKLPKEAVLPALPELFGPRAGIIKSESLKMDTFRKESSDVTLNTFIIYRQNGNRVSFLFSDESPINLAPFNHYDINCVCGFVVKGHSSFPIHQVINTSAIGYISNKSNPRGFEYSINRQSLLKNSDSDAYFRSVSFLLMDIYRDFLKSASSYNPRDISRLYEEGRKSGFSGGVFDTNDVLKQLVQSASDLYCFKLYQVLPDRSYKQCPIQYMDVADLLKHDFVLINGTHFFSIHSGHRQYFDFQNEHYYELSKGLVNSASPTYFVKRGEGDALFNNDPAGYIVFMKINTSSSLYSYLTFFVSHTQSIDPSSSKDWIIGMVRGTWTGYICEKKIIGSTFAFVHQKCYIATGSVLAKRIRELYNDGMYPEICSIMMKLEVALFGHIDPSIEMFM